MGNVIEKVAIGSKVAVVGIIVLLTLSLFGVLPLSFTAIGVLLKALAALAVVAGLLYCMSWIISGLDSVFKIK
jgi:hypothetical protein